MATITLVADTNYSALTVANDDTINCAGFILTLDEQPTETGVQVTSPATNGRVVFSDGWNLGTWDFFAGASTSAGMIGTLPTGATIKSITGGSASNAYGIVTNSGTISGNVTGGAGGVSNGIFTNNGTISGNVTGGAGTNSRGVQNNDGTITGNVSGGTGGTSHGVLINSGTISGNVTGGAGANSPGLRDNTGEITGGVSGGGGTGSHGISDFNGGIIRGGVVGGSASNVYGIQRNYGSLVGGVTGGSAAGANGISINTGIIFGGLAAGVAAAIGVFEGYVFFTDGPLVTGTIASPVTTIYSLGVMNPSATLPVGATVITLSEGTGGAARPVNPFTQQVIG